MDLADITHLRVQNEFENSLFLVLTDKLVSQKGRNYIYLEDCRTQDVKKVEVCPKVGTNRLLIRQNIMKHLPTCNNWIVARVIGNTICIEDINFYENVRAIA